MRTKLIVFAFMVIVAGCKSSNVKEVPRQDIDRNWRIITIDGCEYIENKFRNECPLIHKQNCKNPIHKSLTQ